MISMCQRELFPSLVEVGESEAVSPAGLCGWVLMEPPGYSFLGDNKEEEPCILMHSKQKSQLSVIK